MGTCRRKTRVRRYCDLLRVMARRRRSKATSSWPRCYSSPLYRRRARHKLQRFVQRLLTLVRIGSSVAAPLRLEPAPRRISSKVACEAPSTGADCPRGEPSGKRTSAAAPGGPPGPGENDGQWRFARRIQCVHRVSQAALLPKRVRPPELARRGTGDRRARSDQDGCRRYGCA